MPRKLMLGAIALIVLAAVWLWPRGAKAEPAKREPARMPGGQPTTITVTRRGAPPPAGDWASPPGAHTMAPPVDISHMPQAQQEIFVTRGASSF